MNYRLSRKEVVSLSLTLFTLLEYGLHKYLITIPPCLYQYQNCCGPFSPYLFYCTCSFQHKRSAYETSLVNLSTPFLRCDKPVNLVYQDWPSDLWLSWLYPFCWMLRRYLFTARKASVLFSGSFSNADIREAKLYQNVNYWRVQVSL